MRFHFQLNQSKGLLGSVQLEGQSALLVSSLVLMNQILCSSLVEGLNCGLICRLCNSLILRCNCSVKLLQNSLQLRTSSLIASILYLGNEYALLGRLDIRHWCPPPYSI